MSEFIVLLGDTWYGFLRAAALTVQLTAVSLAFGIVIGLVFAFFRISSSKVLSGIAQVYITVIRGTPLILQIMALYFGIAKLVLLSDFWAGALALAIHNGAYIAEIFRGTIQSIDRGQMEAARSLGMPYGLAMRRIIMPQALKRAIPPLGNQFIIGLKDSSLVGLIGFQELYLVSQSTAARTFLQFESYAIAGMYYLALVMLFTFVLHVWEKRLDVGRKVNTHGAGYG
ncbi:amino acid ABC transporter permease [Brevibacillus parabrevis]|jgi:polar amino acid transport system permease protein|uniref:amino acid ABC transporter permease n=1 Tax=Brevibacillus parabrevis TaxID=54914 RepID=UPI0023801C67|nr:amino acid ABC transporter permease [Brevibacillus parabrevis]MED2253507.1 amino acid ABC transporter permease [Brevibacillus parabrevis]WDV95754.1 amino acid ABC transporter permease [Brevibacillus parabrevis]